jgi:hypothetical protein
LKKVKNTLVDKKKEVNPSTTSTVSETKTPSLQNFNDAKTLSKKK